MKIIRSAVVFLIFAVACNTANNNDLSETNATKQDSNIVTVKDNKTSKTKDLRNECTRGQAQSIIKKSIFPNSKFTLLEDSLSAIETVQFENGDVLTIKNWGCEYYTLTFRFETSRFNEDISNIQFWYKKSALLLHEILEGLESPINLRNGLNEFVNHIDRDMLNNYANLKYGNEINFGGDEIRDIISLDKVEKLSNSKFAITITAATGPL